MLHQTVKYSPLCDVDINAYRLYCLSVVYNGLELESERSTFVGDIGRLACEQRLGIGGESIVEQITTGGVDGSAGGGGRLPEVGDYGNSEVEDGSGQGNCRTQRDGAKKTVGCESIGQNAAGVGVDSSIGGQTRGLHCDVSGDGGSSGHASVGVKLNGVAGCEVKGKHWARNRAKKLAKKQRMASNWRAKVDSSGGCVSDSSASIVTVDTRTGLEIEAAQTLAARRVVENKLAIARGEVQLRSYANKDKTKALEKLDAARMEQRINEAKAKSQASYKKCDESMKSLGSTGSAGEFALKQEVKRAKDNVAILAYVQAQADFMAKHASPEVLAQVAAMPPPVLESEFDVFGDCPENYTEDQRESYFLGLARQQEENDMRTGIPC